MACNEFKTEVEMLFGSISNKLTGILREFYEPYGLTAPQAMILIALHKGASGKISDMAKSLNMTNSNLSVICRRLEGSGYLVRRRDKIDRRVVYLHLTDDSKTLLEKLEQKLSTDYLCLLENASAKDRIAVITGLTILNELLTCAKE